jgi:hypothetical protein
MIDFGLSFQRFQSGSRPTLAPDPPFLSSARFHEIVSKRHGSDGR